MAVFIYKILRQAEWRAAQEAGELTGSPVDLADGYIHFSTAAQVRETAARHFSGAADLVLLAVDSGRLGKALRWEAARGGDLFPHLYEPLSLDRVAGVHQLPLGADGAHVFAAAGL
ncbi:MAG TPA: DUF952 domain-containing protein [Alphaproteobacteria bacterium]|nr:DUF952 domain-containing protein [Alphaproteobacteria bacterium]